MRFCAAMRRYLAMFWPILSIRNEFISAFFILSKKLEGNPPARSGLSGVPGLCRGLDCRTETLGAIQAVY